MVRNMAFAFLKLTVEKRKQGFEMDKERSQDESCQLINDPTSTIFNKCLTLYEIIQ